MELENQKEIRLSLNRLQTRTFTFLRAFYIFLIPSYVTSNIFQDDKLNHALDEDIIEKAVEKVQVDDLNNKYKKDILVGTDFIMSIK